MWHSSDDVPSYVYPLGPIAPVEERKMVYIAAVRGHAGLAAASAPLYPHQAPESNARLRNCYLRELGGTIKVAC